METWMDALLQGFVDYEEREKTEGPKKAALRNELEGKGMNTEIGKKILEYLSIEELEKLKVELESQPNNKKEKPNSPNFNYCPNCGVKLGR